MLVEDALVHDDGIVVYHLEEAIKIGFRSFCSHQIEENQEDGSN